MQTRYETLSSIEFAALPREDQREVVREHEALRNSRVLNAEELEALVDERVRAIEERLRRVGRLEEFRAFARGRHRRRLPGLSWRWGLALLLLALLVFAAARILSR